MRPAGVVVDGRYSIAFFPGGEVPAMAAPTTVGVIRFRDRTVLCTSFCGTGRPQFPPRSDSRCRSPSAGVVFQSRSGTAQTTVRQKDTRRVRIECRGLWGRNVRP